MGSDNRRSRRVKTWFPVRMRTAGTRNTAVAQDVSEQGILIAARKRLELGSIVHVSLHLDADCKTPRLIHGKVVRQEPNRNDPGGLWPYKVAIEFSEPDPSLPDEVTKR